MRIYANAYAYPNHIEVLNHGRVVAHLPVPPMVDGELSGDWKARLSASLLAAGWEHNTWHNTWWESPGRAPQWLLTTFTWTQ